MPIEITMPRLSDTMEEGTLIKWRVRVGDKVANGDVLADVETDKATMELQSYDDGIVALLKVEEGQSAPVGKLILLLAEEGESVEEAVQAVGDGSSQPDAKQPESDQKPSTQVSDAPQDSTEAANAAQGSVSTATGQPLRVSPLARKLAQEHGIDLASLEGSGPDGRIIKRDVLAAQAGSRPDQTAAAPPTIPDAPRATTTSLMESAQSLEAKTIPISNMRRTIARRLVESKTTIPHFTTTMSIDMDPLLGLRSTLNEQLAASAGEGQAVVKLSVNDFIVRASAMALIRHPEVNSTWGDEGIRQHGAVNVGVAVALPQERGGGLVVPTIRHAHLKGLRQISSETRTLAKKARDQGLTVEEMSDGTFTVSNLGMYGVDHFEAIINPPQAAILAVGAAIEKPVARDGQVSISPVMAATLSADHRVVDGATAAQWLATLRQLLENPAVLLV